MLHASAARPMLCRHGNGRCTSAQPRRRGLRPTRSARSIPRVPPTPSPKRRVCWAHGFRPCCVRSVPVSTVSTPRAGAGAGACGVGSCLEASEVHDERAEEPLPRAQPTRRRCGCNNGEPHARGDVFGPGLLVGTERNLLHAHPATPPGTAARRLSGTAAKWEQGQVGQRLSGTEAKWDRG